jgi:hypothetical protein
MINQGNCCMIDKDPSAIGGQEENTSFVLYSRVWTDEEDRFFLKKVQKIFKDNPGKKNQLSFVHLRNLLNGVTLPGGNYSAKTRSTGVTLDPWAPVDNSDTAQLEPILNHDKKKRGN